jgi:hypothetical protein
MSLAFTTFSCLCSPSLLQLDSWFSLLSINYSLRSARLLTAICLNECTSVPFFNAIFKQTSWFPPEITTIRRPKHSLVIFPVAQTHLIHPLGGILFWEGKQTPHTSVVQNHKSTRSIWIYFISARQQSPECQDGTKTEWRKRHSFSEREIDFLFFRAGKPNIKNST